MTTEAKIATFIKELMKSPEWQKAIEESDKKVDKTIEKLKRDSHVDPRQLEEPATI